MPCIESKLQFYELSRRLLLGNRLQQWTWPEFFDIYYSSPEVLPAWIGLRYLDNPRSTATGLYKRRRAFEVAQRTCQRGVLLDEGAPHERLTLQGEVMTDQRGLYLRWSRTQLHQRVLWREDAAHPELGLVAHARGLRASALLQEYFDDMSWECLNQILREYPDAIVEFSAFDTAVGMLGWNTLFWEVRCTQ